MQANIPLGDGKLLWLQSQETFDYRFNLPAQNAFMWPGAAGIAQERGATGKNLFIRSLHMRVRSNDRADLPIQHSCQRGLLGGRLGVEIDENINCLLAHSLNLRADAGEGIFQIRHENGALQIDNSQRRPVAGLMDETAPARCPGRIIQRTQKPPFILQQE